MTIRHHALSSSVVPAKAEIHFILLVCRRNTGSTGRPGDFIMIIYTIDICFMPSAIRLYLSGRLLAR